MSNRAQRRAKPFHPACTGRGCSRRATVNLTFGPVPLPPMCIEHADDFGVLLAVEEIRAGGDGIDGYRRWRESLGLPPAALSDRVAELESA